ncbi:MFS transporter [Lichenifustis flavocetrariae]|uniref:MFS transporter n=1 Tax=Lichenifustis flavocetrariae TaxID=2949735 RepID=UPI0031F54897
MKHASRPLVIAALGVGQILAWGSSYYLLAVLAGLIVRDTGWSLAGEIGGLSCGLLTAGAASPLVGRAIALKGGRPVLATGAVLLGAGLLGLSTAHTLPTFLVAWLVIGLGMGAGLYDPAFATLGRLYGRDARPAITALTLFGGFASTVCWPLSAYLEAHLGWRGACLTYAAIQVGMSLPIYVFALPKKPPPVRETPVPLDTTTVQASVGRVFPALATTVTLASVISTIISVHLLTVLQGKGVGLETAVTLGALVGPAQVGARAIELAVAKRHHPALTNVVATALVASGLGALWWGGILILPSLLLYGAGVGLRASCGERFRSRSTVRSVTRP